MMARDTGPDRSAVRPPTVADMVSVSVRKVGDRATTSRDGNWDAAEPALTSAFATAPQPPERPGPRTEAELESIAQRFAAHCAGDRYGDAAVAGEEIVEYHRRYYGRYHQRTVRWTGRLGEAYLLGGDPGRAVPLIDFALAALESLRGGDDPETRRCRRLLDAARAAEEAP